MTQAQEFITWNANLGDKYKNLSIPSKALKFNNNEPLEVDYIESEYGFIHFPDDSQLGFYYRGKRKGEIWVRDPP